MSNVFGLSEFDSWINDETREALKKFGKGYFALSFWDWQEYKAPFGEVKNSQFNIVYSELQRDSVLELVRRYRNGELSPKDFFTLLVDYVTYVCIWV